MAVRRVEEEIERLTGVRDPAVLRKALSDRVGLVVAKAAKVAAARKLDELVPDLLRAFDRLFEKPAERDPQCWAKNALAQALVDLGYRDSPPYLRGARHIQMEAVWGGQEDTASNLRGICLLALVTCRDVPRETILRCLVDALAERQYTVRVEAARALAQLEGDDSALLLRLKARLGDKEPPVVGQVFDALLRIEGAEAVDFLASFLSGPSEEVREEAALALGGSRLPAALTVLRDRWTAERDPDLRLSLLRGLSVSRDDAALDFLLEIIRTARPRDVASAIEALAIHRESAEIRARVEAAVEEAGGSAHDDFRRSFTLSASRG